MKTSASPALRRDGRVVNEGYLSEISNREGREAPEGWGMESIIIIHSMNIRGAGDENPCVSRLEAGRKGGEQRVRETYEG